MFFLSIFEQFRRKGRFYQLMWTVSTAGFVITTGAETLSLILGEWLPTIYRVYYVTAGFQVALLGGGVIFLLANRQVINDRNTAQLGVIFGFVWFMFGLIFTTINPTLVVVFLPALLLLVTSGQHWLSSRVTRTDRPFISGHAFAYVYLAFILVIFAQMTAYAFFVTPLNLEVLVSGGSSISGLGWQNPPDGSRAVVRLFSPLLTIPGSIGLVGGAVWSYILIQSSIKRQTGHYSPKVGVFNLYFIVGGLMFGAGDAFAGLGVGSKYITEAIALTLIFVGFLLSDKISFTKFFSLVTLGFYDPDDKSSFVRCPTCKKKSYYAGMEGVEEGVSFIPVSLPQTMSIEKSPSQQTELLVLVCSNCRTPLVGGLTSLDMNVPQKYSA